MLFETPFTGEIIYEYENFSGIEKTKYVIGEDFYYKKMSGESLDIFKLNKEMFMDISENKQYRIFNDRLEIDSSIQIQIAKPHFDNLRVSDTITYLGYQCEVVEFKLINTTLNTVASYIYYYPIEDLIPSKQFDKLPRIFNYENTIFRPFDQKSIPVYILCRNETNDSEFIIHATSITPKKVSREDYFGKVKVRQFLDKGDR